MPQAIAVTVAGWATAAGAGAAAGAIGAAVSGMVVGAAIGGLTAAVTGGDIGKGLLFGAIGGAVVGGISGAMGGAAGGTSGGTAGGATTGTAQGMTPAVLNSAAQGGTAGITATGNTMSLAGGAGAGGGGGILGQNLGDGLLQGAAGSLIDIGGKMIGGSATEDMADKNRAEAARQFNEELKTQKEKNAISRLNVEGNIAQGKQTLADARAEADTGRRLAEERRRRQSSAVTDARAARQGMLAGNPLSVDKQIIANERDLMAA